LAVLDRQSPVLARFLRREAAPRYSPAAIDSLYAARDGRTMTDPPGQAVGRQWAALVLGHPWLYLRTRAAVWRFTLLTPPSGACPMVFTGVDDGDAAMLRRAALALRDDDKDDWDDDYARAFERTPLFSHAVYGLLVILALVAGLRRWRRGDRDAVLIANLALCACAILFVAGFFVISIACDYRYLYFLDVAAMAAITREAAVGSRREAL
jgi:hypothetical protein